MVPEECVCDFIALGDFVRCLYNGSCGLGLAGVFVKNGYE